MYVPKTKAMARSAKASIVQSKIYSLLTLAYFLSQDFVVRTDLHRGGFQPHSALLRGPELVLFIQRGLPFLVSYVLYFHKGGESKITSPDCSDVFTVKTAQLQIHQLVKKNLHDKYTYTCAHKHNLCNTEHFFKCQVLDIMQS